MPILNRFTLFLITFSIVISIGADELLLLVGDKVNLRARPAIDSKILQEMPAATALMSIGDYDPAAEWVYVLHLAAPMKGYVFGRYLKARDQFTEANILDKTYACAYNTESVFYFKFEKGHKYQTAYLWGPDPEKGGAPTPALTKKGYCYTEHQLDGRWVCIESLQMNRWGNYLWGYSDAKRQYVQSFIILPDGINIKSPRYPAGCELADTDVFNRKNEIYGIGVQN